MKCIKCGITSLDTEAEDGVWQLECIHRRMTKAEMKIRKDRIRWLLSSQINAGLRATIKNFPRKMAYNEATCPDCQEAPHGTPTT